MAAHSTGRAMTTHLEIVRGVRYTVAMREKGKAGKFLYIGEDLKTYPIPDHSAPLRRDQAELAAQMLRDGAEKEGRPIETRLVELSKENGR